MIPTVFIVSHGIMSRVEQELCDMGFRKELEHGEIGIQKAMRVMPGSRSQERKNREVAFRVRCREHVEIISEIVAASVGIPTDVTIRLVIEAAAFAVTDPFFHAIARTGLPLPGTGVNRGSVTGNGKVLKVDQFLANGSIQKHRFKDIKETFRRSEILRRFDLKFSQEVIDRYFFNRVRLFAFLLWLFWFLLRRVERIGNVVPIRQPQTAGKIIEGTNTRGVPDGKTGKDGIEVVLFQTGSPGSKGRDFEFHGKQIRAQHIRRKPWFRAEDGITILHDLIYRRKVKIPKMFHHFPGGMVKRRICIWIIYTELSQDTVLIGGMAADVNRFQSVYLQSRAYLLLN